MNWEQIVEKVAPYIVKIETPTGSGTGFLCGYNAEKTYCLIATAFHVVKEADEWQQPLKIHNSSFDKQVFLQESQRFIFTDYKTDSAVIFCPCSDLTFPEGLIPLRPMDVPISVGTEVGWLGYPGIAAYTLCFFSGNISAKQDGYLIDGVAINGVSGGPVMYSSATEGIEFVGVITAYHANRLTGSALPGLSVAQDVSHLHGVIQRIKSVDEAKRKKLELDAQAQAQAQTQAQSQPQPPQSEPQKTKS